MLKENIKLRKENKGLRQIIKGIKESEGYWSKECTKVEEKAELYRNKYMKWKMKTKGIRKMENGKHKENNNRMEKVNKRKVKRCYTCGKQGHLSRECYKNWICEKCNKKGYTKEVCRSKMKG